MKLIFCGDMAFTSSTGENEILNTEMVNLFREYDFKCVNFECTMKGDEIKKIGPSLILNETMCEAIKKADFDLFCLANNQYYGSRDKRITKNKRILLRYTNDWGRGEH